MKFLFHVSLFCFVFLESSAGHGETPNAFIFSLNNFKGLAPFVSKVKKEKTKTAIYRSSVYGPVFGQNLFIFLDAASVGNSFAYLGGRYPYPASEKDKKAILDGHGGNFSPDEVEVFYLDPSRQMQNNTN